MDVGSEIPSFINRGEISGPAARHGLCAMDFLPTELTAIESLNYEFKRLLFTDLNTHLQSIFLNFSNILYYILSSLVQQ
jgi:hypothetical protein